MKTMMKNLMTTLLVTFMLLFTVSVNSQTQTTTYGNGNDFDTTQFVLESDNGDFIAGTFVQLYGDLAIDDSLTFTCPLDLSNLSEVKLEFDKNGQFDVNIMYTVNDTNYIEKMDRSGIIYTYNPAQTGDFTNIKISFVVKSPVNGLGHNINYIKFTYNEDVTSLDKNNLEESFDIYSYSNIVNVKTNEFKDYNLKVYNTSGRVVFSGNKNGNFRKSFSDKGIYIVKLKFENKVLTKKIFIK